MDFLSTALEALPHISTSPLAFVGYIIVVISWLILSLRVKRNKQMLKHLDKLPKKDRLEALQMELGSYCHEKLADVGA